MRIILLFIVACILFSCESGNKTFYYIDELKNDTIASCLYSKGEDNNYTKFLIIVRDSIYGEENVDELLKKLDVISELSDAAKERRIEKMLSPNFYLYLKKGYFSNFSEEIYNARNFYLKGQFYYHEWINSRDYDSYKIKLYWNKPELTSSMDLKLEKEKEESVNALLRDSVMKVLGQQYRRLSFMDYQLGGSYLKKRKYIIGQTIQGEEIDGIDILHYDNTIYEIKVYFKDYENGFDTPELNKILDLYREKYGNNYGGNEWVFSNSSIKIETKLEEFTIGKNGELIRGKRRDMPQRNVITEIVITYYDNEVDSILKVKRQKDELIEKKKKEDEEKVRHQQLLDNI